MTIKDSRPPYLTEGILLALATIAAYGFVYSYEKGVCDYYGLPSEVISIGLWHAIDFFVRSITFIYVTIGVVYYITFFYLKHNMTRRLGALPRTIVSKWATGLPILLAYLLYGRMSLGLLVFMGIAIFVFFMFDFGIPYLTRGEMKWIDRIIESEEAEWSSPRLWDIVPRYVYLFCLLIFGLMVGNNVVHSAGEKFAANRVQYHTLLDDGEEYAILRVYGNTFYGSLYDDDSKHLLGKFKAFDSVGHKWELANLGPLGKHVVEKEVKELAMSHADKNEHGRWEVHVPLDDVDAFEELIKDEPIKVTRRSKQDAISSHQLYEFDDGTDINILDPILDDFFD